ncbi:MAG: hypothetical protein DMD80_06255 [Candidatus Rokuibacteriota bacterium]|nr:MAG: hypothetical protein DMD80_06255 [Candidatus Rokubacteria bacterium]PYN29260.1 MAG: hypothetical protein DMD76_01815 [Candidatus Rokubacteria bacterium]
MLVPDGGTPHDRIPLVRRGHHRPREPDLPLRQACVLHRRSPGCPSRHEGSAEPARAAQAGGSPAGAQRLGGEVRSSIVALAAAVALTVAAVAAAAPDFASLQIQPYEPPKPAPAFSLPGLDGTPQTLESLRGKVVLLFFWATW